MYVRHAPASTYRMKPRVKMEGVTAAGTPADSASSPFIPQGIIHDLYRARDGVSELCINSRICLKGINHSVV